MDAATNQTGSTRISSLVVASVASGTVVGLVALGVLTGVLPNRAPVSRGDEAPRVESQAKPSGMPAASCALCGTIESVRIVEVYEESTSASGAVDPRSGEPTGTAPGAPATGGASVFDTLASAVRGDDAEKSARRRRVYRVTLRMDDGSFRAISMPGPPAFAVGDKVRVVEGRLVRA
jgi:outer membrane lipoprotein SlyB